MYKNLYHWLRNCGANLAKDIPFVERNWSMTKNPYILRDECY